MTRRNARVRFAFCCSKCGTWVPGGARCYTDDGTWWFCQQCALEHTPEATTGRTSP